MTARPYVPAAGLAGKVKRLAARSLARSPLRVAPQRPIVTFTFDDFPKSAATTAADRLETHDWRATYFASGAFAGGASHLGRHYDVSDLNRLSRSGHEIGCHTFRHGDAGALSAEETAADCARNRRFLEMTGLESDLVTFAFPYGEARPAAKRALLSRYRALRGVHPGINRGRADRGLLKAVPLDGGEAGLGRALAAVRDVAARPGWLIFYGHDIRETPSRWGCTPAFFKAVCDAVAAENLDVLTFRAALDRLEAA